MVIKDAVEMQVDAVVHAGDLFDSRNPTLEDLLETMNILSRLKTANIPFFWNCREPREQAKYPVAGPF